MERAQAWPLRVFHVATLLSPPSPAKSLCRRKSTGSRKSELVSNTYRANFSDGLWTSLVDVHMLLI